MALHQVQSSKSPVCTPCFHCRLNLKRVCSTGIQGCLNPWLLWNELTPALTKKQAVLSCAPFFGQQSCRLCLQTMSLWKLCQWTIRKGYEGSRRTSAHQPNRKRREAATILLVYHMQYANGHSATNFSICITLNLDNSYKQIEQAWATFRECPCCCGTQTLWSQSCTISLDTPENSLPMTRAHLRSPCGSCGATGCENWFSATYRHTPSRFNSSMAFDKGRATWKLIR